MVYQMENLDFLESIDKAFTSIGMEKRWVRVIAGRKFIFGPISYTGSHRWKDTILQSIESANTVLDSRRIMLSEAIMGVDDIDFSGIDPSEKKFQVRVDGKVRAMNIREYLAHKMLDWDSQLIEDMFNVYADITQSMSSDNLKEVVFENVRDPRAMLVDLTSQVNELRAELNLEPLIDPSDVKVETHPHQSIQEEDTPPTVDIPDRVERYTPVPSVLHPQKSAVPADVPSAPTTPEPKTHPSKPYVPSSVADIIKGLDAEVPDKVVFDPSKIDSVQEQSVNPRFRR